LVPTRARRVDDPALLLGADQRPCGLVLHRLRQRLALLVRDANNHGAFANALIPQLEDEHLREKRLLGVHAGHCDWQRPHSVQVAKSRKPFQVKSSIFDRPKIVDLGVGLLEVQVLAVALHRQQRAQSVGLAGEGHVQRGAMKMCMCLE